MEYKTMKLSFLVTLAVSISCILASVLTAQEPQVFRYQGRILDNDALVSGNLDFSFKLYDTPIGGTSLYEDAATITVADGLYSTMIGDDTTSGGDLGDALNNPAVYLEIEVGGETLTPRERIVSVPYAMNGLPSGSVVLSASNPNAALEAKGYSLVYSDVNLPEDWADALQNVLVTPFDGAAAGMNTMEMVTFGSFVGFYSKDRATEGEETFYYSQDGIFWNESDLPFYEFGEDFEVLGFRGGNMFDESVELNASLYMMASTATPAPGEASLLVTTTSNGADWTELSVSLPVSFSDILVSQLEVFANQIWLYAYSPSASSPSNPSGYLLLKSSDGATWDEAAVPAWEAPAGMLEIVSTPDRLVVLAPFSGGDGTYVWSTTDGSSWSISNAALPTGEVVTPAEGPEIAYANGALWLFDSRLEGADIVVGLYKSTDWGNSWSQVITNLPSIQTSSLELISLAPSPGLLLAVGDGAAIGASYISADGSDWKKVASDNLLYSPGYAEDSDNLSISSTGKAWLYYSEESATVAHQLYSIGGPLRNGRFFYYQKD
jgi:hypothetical protein